MVGLIKKIHFAFGKVYGYRCKRSCSEQSLPDNQAFKYCVLEVLYLHHFFKHQSFKRAKNFHHIYT